MWETFFRGRQPRQRVRRMPSPPSGAAPGEHSSTLAALAAAGTSCKALETTAKLPPTPPSCFFFAAFTCALLIPPAKQGQACPVLHNTLGSTEPHSTAASLLLTLLAFQPGGEPDPLRRLHPAPAGRGALAGLCPGPLPPSGGRWHPGR